MVNTSIKFPHFLNRINALHRLLICLGVGIAVFIILHFYLPGLDRLTKILASWDVFAFAMIALSWIIFYYINSGQIRQKVKEQDTSRLVSLLIVIISAFSSLMAIIIILADKQRGVAGNNFHIPVAITGMVLSWFFVHTIFTFHYAHLYYGDDKQQPGIHAGGLIYPGEDMPDYLDFAYFSFIIGMTFQVSDVSVSTRSIRRLVLFHSILAFVFNTVIVALSINIIASLQM